MCRSGLQQPGFAPTKAMSASRYVTCFPRGVYRARIKRAKAYTFSMTMPSINPVSLRPSGLAESPLLLIVLIGLTDRLSDVFVLFNFAADFNR